MDPSTAAIADDLHRQRARIHALLVRLESAERVRPGAPTFWTGLSRMAYERRVEQLDVILAAAADALRMAEQATLRALQRTDAL